MKVTVPEISFHNRDPVLGVDLQHNSEDGVIRMATAGTDTHVVIWQLTPLPTGGVSVEFLCDLTRHTRAVNAVRFSPDGSFLATGDDDSAIIVWKKQELFGSSAPDLFGEDSETKNKENWVIFKMLRGHIQDVCDLSWSSCSNFLVSGSIDNSAIMWDVQKGKSVGLLKEHKNFVQGVAWDPKGQFIATLSSDRLLRWFNVTTKRVVHKSHKASLPKLLDDNTVKFVNTRLFYDDTLKSFCRRLSFSPDGLILVAPSGILEDDDPNAKMQNAVHVFTKISPLRPVLYLPTKDKYTLAVRFCPLLFTLRKGREGTEYTGTSIFGLPYRMVFAVACQNSVILYDTQQLVPFAKMSNMHYTRLTDLAWSSDGRILAISSTDGYCSLAYFNEGELGNVYSPQSEAQETANETESIEKVLPEVKGEKGTESVKKEEDMDVEDNTTVKENKSQVNDASSCTSEEQEKMEEDSKPIVGKQEEKVVPSSVETNNATSKVEKEIDSKLEDETSKQTEHSKVVKAPESPLKPTIKDKEEFLRAFEMKKIKPINILVPRKAPKSTSNPSEVKRIPLTMIKRKPTTVNKKDVESSTSKQIETGPSTSKSEAGPPEPNEAGPSKQNEAGPSTSKGETEPLAQSDCESEELNSDSENDERESNASDDSMFVSDNEIDGEEEENKIDLGESDSESGEEEEVEEEEEDLMEVDEVEEVVKKSSKDLNSVPKSSNTKMEIKSTKEEVVKSSDKKEEVVKSSDKKEEGVKSSDIKEAPKTPRRVPLISVPINKPFTKDSPKVVKKDPAPSVDTLFNGENTEDLCLRLDGDTNTDTLESALPKGKGDTEFTNQLKKEDVSKENTKTRPVPVLSNAGKPSPVGGFGSGSKAVSGSKTPRRVALITLASPKAKRSLTAGDKKPCTDVAKALQDK